jgi:hypothetical protein
MRIALLLGSPRSLPFSIDVDIEENDVTVLVENRHEFDSHLPLLFTFTFFDPRILSRAETSNRLASLITLPSLIR